MINKPDDEYGLLIEPVNRYRALIEEAVAAAGRTAAGQDRRAGMSRRPRIFTPAALDGIKAMVAEGLGKQLIADKVGCTPGSLKVVCSKKGISLRKPRQQKPAEPKPPMTALRLSISHVAMLSLQKHAADKGCDRDQARYRSVGNHRGRSALRRSAR